MTPEHLNCLPFVLQHTYNNKNNNNIPDQTENYAVL